MAGSRPARRSPLIEPTHVEWQEQAVALAHYLGWQHLHIRRTVGRGRQWTTSTNIKGWPDLWLWKAGVGFAGVELKVGKDTATPEQMAVLASLSAAGARTMVAYPSDLEALSALLAAPAPRATLVVDDAI